MKVLVAHNYHRKGSASGDDKVFKSETELLKKNGIEVIKYSVRNDSFDSAGIIGKIKSTFGMLWSFKNYKEIQKIIRREKPDIVHVHTFFPLLSPSILYAAKKNGCKVIATLHDTRFVCPCATSLRGNTLCNKCSDGRYFRMFKYSCFKNSKLQSLIVAINFKFHRIIRSFYKRIDCYICLNDNQIELLVNAGFDSNKIVKKYNFVEDMKGDKKNEEVANLPKRYVVYYGRIGEEKGIQILEKIWDNLSDIPLVVMGAGPLENQFKDWANQHEQVYFLGYTQQDKCLSIVKGAEFVIFPSIWYEGCSMVEIETENLGKPLIATDLGFSVEAIENGVNGYKVKLGDVNGFVDAVKKLWSKPELCETLGANARADYEAKYLPGDNYRQLIQIYKKTLKR